MSEEAETDVCTEVVLSADDAERDLDVLDAVEPNIEHSWAGKQRHLDAVRRGPGGLLRIEAELVAGRGTGIGGGRRGLLEKELERWWGRKACWTEGCA